MKKLLFSILIFLFSFSFAYSADSEKSEIASIKYSGNLDQNTVIEIRGNNLKECIISNFQGTDILTQSKNITKLTFLYSQLDSYSGGIELKCPTGIIKKGYAFPFIEKVSGLGENDLNKTITISGKNFGKIPEVKINGGTFKKHSVQDRLIIGELPNTIRENNLYVIADGLKSNLMNLDIGNPIIDFVDSKDNFLKNTEIIVHGTHLNDYNTTTIFFGETKVENFKYNDKEGTLSFIPEGNFGKKTLKIISNGFESNEIDINISGGSPIIKSVYKRYINEEINGLSTRKEVLVISGENFPESLLDIKIYHNGIRLTPTRTDSNEIIFEKYILAWGDNFFQLDINGDNSNVFNFKEEFDLAQVSAIELGTIENGKRNIMVHLIDFNESTDTIFFNNSKIAPVGCLGTMCRIQIPESTLKGHITSGRGNDKNPKYQSFDISYQNMPFIDYMLIKGDLKQGTKIEIVGSNFSNATVAASNLFETDARGKIEVNISDTLIEGRLALKYNPDSISSVTIRKYAQTSEISFKGKNLDGEKIYGRPYIKELISTSNDNLVKSGNIVHVIGKGLMSGYLVNIGNIKTSLSITDSSHGFFEIPDSMKEGRYNVFIENEQGGKGNRLPLIIVSNDTKSQVVIGKEDIKIHSFALGEVNKNSIYNLSLLNQIENLRIKFMSFKIENYSKENYLGTFILQIGGKQVSISSIEDDGIINFPLDYEWVPDVNKITISVVKDSKYIKDIDFKINFIKDSLEITKGDTSTLFNDIVFSNITSQNIKLTSVGGKNCLDSDKKNIHCNNIVSIEEPENIEEPKDNVSENIGTESNSKMIIDMIRSKKNLEKTSTGKKYKTKIDSIVLKMSEKKLSLLYTKLDKIDTSLPKYKKIKDIVDYLKAKTGIKIYENNKYITF